MFVEIVEYSLKPGITEEHFLQKCIEGQTTFVEKQDGFISREVLKGEHGKWAVIVHWKNKRSAEKAVAAFNDHPGSQQMIELFDLESSVVRLYDVKLSFKDNN